MIIKSLAGLGRCTCELVLIANDIGMVKFLHYVDFLVNILLQKRFLLDMHLANNFDRIVNLGCF
jgi:hypothetical protein